MSTNPYQTPSFGGPMPPYGQDPTEEAIRQLKVPAMTLLIMAVITIFVRIVQLAFDFLLIGQQVAPEGTARVVGSIVGNGVALLLNIATIAGAWKMMRAESYSSAMAAAVISVIPVCSPCLIFGIPFGIWAIVILRKPEVKAAFRP